MAVAIPSRSVVTHYTPNPLFSSARNSQASSFRRLRPQAIATMTTTSSSSSSSSTAAVKSSTVTTPEMVWTPEGSIPQALQERIEFVRSSPSLAKFVASDSTQNKSLSTLINYLNILQQLKKTLELAG